MTGRFEGCDESGGNAREAEYESGAHDQAAEQEDEREKENDGEEMELGVVAEAGGVPAVKGFKEWHEERGGEQEECSELKKSKLEQTPHEAMLAQEHERRRVCAGF